MKFLLDLQTLQSRSRQRGIVRYSRGLADAFLRGSGAGDASVLLNASIAPFESFDDAKLWITERISGDGVRTFCGLSNIAGTCAANPAWLHAGEALYDSYIASLDIELVHIASPFEGFGDDTVVGWTDLARTGPARAVTVYDLIPFEAPDVYLANPVRDFWYRRRLAGLRKADLLLAISEHTRKQAIAMLDFPPDRVVNIGADTEPVFRKTVLSLEERTQLLALHGIRKPFIIHTGVLDERKNVAALVRAFAMLTPELRAAYELVFVADATETQVKNIKSVARAAGLDPASLVFTGFVDDGDLAKLYGVTTVAIMPSLAEGFGLPMLEAMRCGAPVLGSDRTSIPEVVGNRELLFDPARPAALADKLRLMLTDADFRSRAIAHSAVQERCFSWRKAADTMLDAFKDTVSRKRARPVPPRRRPQYILVPPANPPQSQADQVADVAAALTRHAEVSVDVIGPKRKRKRHDECNFPVSTELLKISPQRRILLLSGAETFDRYHTAILRSMPAVVVASPKASLPMSRDWVYRQDGYPGLLAAGERFIAFDGLPAVEPNVLDVLEFDDRLSDRIESIYESHPLARILGLLTQLEKLDAPQCNALATAATENHASQLPMTRLLVDITELARRDPGSGIQRVVKGVLRYLLMDNHDLRIEPIYRDGGIYRYARKFTCDFLSIPALSLADAVVDFNATDIYLGLDLDPNITQPAADILARLRRRGGSVNFLVYDVLPLQRSDWFPPDRELAFNNWLRRIAEAATRIIAVSQTVADEAIALLDRVRVRRAEPIEVTFNLIGSDFVYEQQDGPTIDEDAGLPHIATLWKGRPTFLTVGTIEPRKGIGQLIDAAEDLWRHEDAIFVIVGRRGWFVDRLSKRLKRHPEYGTRLFWFAHGISDATLDQFYRQATAVVLPSEGEGFGLPLIEAAWRGTPIIARDIAAFREIGGDSVYFFKADTGIELAAALRAWLELNRHGLAPPSSGIKTLSWQESTQHLVKALRGRAPYLRWSG